MNSAAVITHGQPRLIEPALERVRALAARIGVELVGDDVEPDIAIVLGGDGTMLRALRGSSGRACRCSESTSDGSGS